MVRRHLLPALLLLVGCLGLNACGGGGNDASGCTNLIGNVCLPVNPTGTVSATPNPAIEGQVVNFSFNITDPSPTDAVTCEFDPEGDGTFQLNVSCTGNQSFIYQSTGNFRAAVRATDTQDSVVRFTTRVRVIAAAAGSKVTQFRLLDASRNPVTNATVCVIPNGATVCNTVDFVVSGDTGGGVYNVTGPAAGLPIDTTTNDLAFKLQITQGDGIATTPVVITLDPVEVDNDNQSTSTTFITPFDCSSDADNCTDVNKPTFRGTLATISGIVTDASTGSPIDNAQVSISGGLTTGGPYSIVFTNPDGEFNLLINVGTNLTSAITNSTIRINKDGFSEVVSQFAVTPRHFFGLNFSVPPAPTTPPIFSENFEGASAADWVAEGGIDNVDPNLKTFWQLLDSASPAGMPTNTRSACTNPAPGDASARALLAQPPGGSRVFWYGARNSGSFIGTESSCTGGDGGSSDTAHSGTLTSPPISLGGVSGDVKLTFKTFWEIESKNPNASGFDLMNIYVSTDGGATFDLVGKTNPLSDPAGVEDRDAIPFTNTGFNSPPLWVQQESFALSNVAGQTIRLRFEFDTKDEAYNGFRGWMIDDIRIEGGKGSLGSGASSTTPPTRDPDYCGVIVPCP